MFFSLLRTTAKFARFAYNLPIISTTNTSSNNSSSGSGGLIDLDVLMDMSSQNNNSSGNDKSRLTLFKPLMDLLFDILNYIEEVEISSSTRKPFMVHTRKAIVMALLCALMAMSIHSSPIEFYYELIYLLPLML